MKKANKNPNIGHTTLYSWMLIGDRDLEVAEDFLNEIKNIS